MHMRGGGDEVRSHFNKVFSDWNSRSQLPLFACLEGLKGSSVNCIVCYLPILVHTKLDLLFCREGGGVVAAMLHDWSVWLYFVEEPPWWQAPMACGQGSLEAGDA